MKYVIHGWTACAKSEPQRRAVCQLWRNIQLGKLMFSGRMAPVKEGLLLQFTFAYGDAVGIEMKADVNGGTLAGGGTALVSVDFADAFIHGQVEYERIFKGNDDIQNLCLGCQFRPVRAYKCIVTCPKRKCLFSGGFFHGGFPYTVRAGSLGGDFRDRA